MKTVTIEEAAMRTTTPHAEGSREGTIRYAFGTAFSAWRGFEVVRFCSREAIGELYQYEIILARAAQQGRVDLSDLVGAPATFRLADEDIWRNVHGIVAEAQELECTSELILYRVLLTPRLWRAMHRRHCRTFVDRTIQEIVSSVLENRFGDEKDPELAPWVAENGGDETAPSFDSFATPMEKYRFRLQDPARIQDRSLRAYVVQYNETDWDFVSRLLEEEGLSTVFHHEATTTVLTVTDAPRFEPSRSSDAQVRLRNARQGEEVGVWSLTESRRMRTTSVTVRDWDPSRPREALEGRARHVDPRQPASSLSAHVFPGRDEATRIDPDNAPAKLLLDRELTEMNLGSGSSNVRGLRPGFAFHLTDDAGARDPSTWVVTSLVAMGVQRMPQGTVLDEMPFGFVGERARSELYQNRFDVIPEGTVFRPARRTPVPRVHGVHTAVVSADEIAGKKPEIHCSDKGMVRLRFPWDERVEIDTPSSCWARVSQAWAGAGFGSMMIPRVGQEVLVAYLQGDLERPMVIGRVYNALEPEPYPLPAAKTRSTWRSRSTPDSDGFNEIRFEDAAGAEEIFLHAQRNLNEVVLGSHSESVGGDQSYGIGGHQTFTVGSDQVFTVKGNRALWVAGSNFVQQAYFSSHADTDHAFESVNTTFKMSDMFGVASVRSRVYGSSHVVVRGDGYVHVESNDHVRLSAGAAFIDIRPGHICIDNGSGTSIDLIGPHIAIKAGGMIHQVSNHAKIDSGFIGLSGASGIDAHGAIIKLNG